MVPGGAYAGEAKKSRGRGRGACSSVGRALSSVDLCAAGPARPGQERGQERMTGTFFIDSTNSRADDALEAARDSPR